MQSKGRERLVTQSATQTPVPTWYQSSVALLMMTISGALLQSMRAPFWPVCGPLSCPPSFWPSRSRSEFVLTAMALSRRPTLVLLAMSMRFSASGRAIKRSSCVAKLGTANHHNQVSERL